MGYERNDDSWDLVYPLIEIAQDITSVSIFDQKIVWGVGWGCNALQNYYAQGTNNQAIYSLGSGLDLIDACIKLNDGEVPMTSKTWAFGINDAVENWPDATMAIGWWYRDYKAYCYCQIGTAGFMTAAGFENTFNMVINTLQNRCGYHGFNPLSITSEDHEIFTAYFLTASVFEDDSRNATTPQSAVKVWQVGCAYNTNRVSEPLYLLTNSGQLYPNDPLHPEVEPIYKLPAQDSDDPTASHLYHYIPGVGYSVGWKFPADLATDIDDFIEDSINEDQIGGDGEYNLGSDGTGINDLPNKGILESGMCKLFLPTSSDMHTFASELWNNASAITAAFGGFVSNPMEAIINLGLLPLDLHTLRGTAQQLQLGSYTMTTTMSPASTEYVEVTLGSIVIPGKWNSALDFAPFSKFSIYLPYLGYYDLPAEEIVTTNQKGDPNTNRKVLSVFYKIHLFTGDFVAQVTLTKNGKTNVIQQFTGNMMLKIPVTGMDYSAYYKAQHDLGVSALSNFASGNIFGGIIDSIGFAAGAANPAGNVCRSGNFDGSTSRMAYRNCFIIRTYPNQIYQKSSGDSVGFDKYSGFPCYKIVTLNEGFGFAKIRDILLDGFTLTDEEEKELRQLLQEGVYL